MSLSTDSLQPEYFCYATSCGNSLGNSAFGNENDAFGNILYLRYDSQENNAPRNVHHLQKHNFRENIAPSQTSQAAQSSQFPNTNQYLVSRQHDTVAGIYNYAAQVTVLPAITSFSYKSFYSSGN